MKYILLFFFRVQREIYLCMHENVYQLSKKNSSGSQWNRSVGWMLGGARVTHCFRFRASTQFSIGIARLLTMADNCSDGCDSIVNWWWLDFYRFSGYSMEFVVYRISGCGVTNSKRRFIQRCLCLVRIVPCLAETQTKCRLRSCCEMSTVRPYAECQCRGNTSRVHVSITATCARCVCLWSFKMCVLSVACNVNGSFIWCLAVNQAN